MNELTNTDKPQIAYSECCTLPYLNMQIEDIEGEEWIDILGYDGIYLVSNLGRIKSYQREINMGRFGIRIQPERIMKQHISKSNPNNLKELSKSLQVSFSVDKKKTTYHVSTLVGNAFVGELKVNEVYSKKNKLWNDNRADNLVILKKTDDIKLAYEKGNNLRKKKHLTINHENKFIYTRLNDGKKFASSDLFNEYGKEIRSNLKKAIKKNSFAYGSKWSRELI